MALFMGRKPSDGKPLLHVTSGAESISQLDGKPIASTLFHSDIPYLAIYDVIEVTRFRKVKSTKSGSSWTHYYEPIVPQEVWDYMSQRNLMVATTVYHSPTRVAHFPATQTTIRGTGNDVSYDLFIGNFHGSGFANGNIPYPYDPVPNTGIIYGHWDPLTAYKNSLEDEDKTSDQGVRATMRDETGVWNVSGLQKDLRISKYQYYKTSNINKTSSRSTSANYSNPTRNLEDLFGNPFYRDNNSSAPSTLTYSASKPSTRNWKLRIYVLNVRYNSQNNLEHVKPVDSDGIKISREDMVVGDLSMKNGMLLSDPNPEVTNVRSTQTTNPKHSYFDTVTKGLTLAQLANYPFLHYFEVVGANASSRTWNANYYNPYYNDVLPLVRTPSALLGSNISLEFSADEIKYKGSKGEFLIASKARKYTPYILGGDSAITAVFPAETKNYSQLRQGATFQRRNFSGQGVTIYNPTEVGHHVKEVVKQRIPLPPGSTGSEYLTAHLSPIYMHGEASSTTHGKKSKMQVSINGFAGWGALRLFTFKKNDPDREIIVGDLAYSVLRDVSLTRVSEGSLGSGYWPRSSSGNKMQSVRIQYKIRVNWIRNELELVAYYRLTNARIEARERRFNTYYNKLGETEVTYRIPEIRFGFYVTGAS